MGNNVRWSVASAVAILAGVAVAADTPAPRQDGDMFDSGAAGDVTLQMNRMWATFGRGENVRLTPFGNEPGWYEWMARRHCWSDTPEYRDRLRGKLIDWPQSKDGYLWTWGNQEGWPTHGVRHYENNGKYILAVCKYYSWQGGKAFLDKVDTTTSVSVRPNQTDVSEGRTVLEKVRAAMYFQLTALDGQSGLAIVTDPQCDGTADGMPTDYWDNFRFGYKTAYVNIYFYASLLAMAELEASLGKSARSGELRTLAAKVKETFGKTFWDAEKGRFIGCLDITGRRWDFGFTYLNLEAIAYGLATPEQAGRIFEWLDGERIIACDKQQVGSRMTGVTGAEIYDLGWAPRSITRAVESIQVDGKYWWWHLNNRINVGGASPNASYGEHVENGGAIFYVSHYDMMARLDTFGADNAWQRFEGILAEHRKDGLKRDPRNNAGVDWKWGIIGEFPESGLVPATIALGFMGLDATPDALVVRPRLPQALPWLEIRHVAYRGGIYSIKADRQSILVACIRESPEPAKLDAGGGPVFLPKQGRTVSITVQ